MTEGFPIRPSRLVGLFLAVIALLPLWHPLNIDFSEYNIKRIAEILLVTGAALLLPACRELRVRWLETFRRIPELARLGVVAFFGLGVISTLQAELPRYGFLETGLLALLFLFALAIAAEVAGREAAAGRLVWMLFAAIALYCVAFYVNLFLPFGNNALAPGFSNLRFVAQFQAWTLPLMTLPLSLKPEMGTARRGLVLAVAGLWWGVAFFNSAKGLGVAVVLNSLLALALMRTPHARSWLMLQLKVLLGGLAIYLILTFATSQGGYLTGVEGSFASRLTLWQESLGHIARHPLLGIGPLHLSNHYNGLGAHPHNSLLQIAAEWGLPAMLIVLSLFIWGFVAWLRSCVKRQTPMEIALGLSLGSGAVYSLVSGVIVMPLSQIMLALVAGLMLARHQATLTPQSPPSRRSQWLLAATVILLLIRFASVLFPEVLHLPRKEFVWIATHAQDGHLQLQPRFWQQGWFQR